MPALWQFLLVALGGAAGACSRYAVQHFSFFNDSKFYLTAIVNLVGCLVIGVVWSLISHATPAKWVNPLIMAGFLGGFTTFSSFALDTVKLMADGHWLEGAGYLLLSTVGGLMLCAAGWCITNRLIFNS